MTEQMKAALKYAAKGWEVFPIERGTKDKYFYYPEYPGEPSEKYPKGTPYSWKAQASKDPERVRKFWTDHPDANIGIATGQRSGGLFIVDEDEKDGRQGIANFEKWIDDNTLYLDEGVMVKTPSGGRHEYFIANETIAPTRTGWLPGVDIRGENNGYVLLPPSYYEDPKGEHTGSYEWITSPEECSVLSDKEDPNIVYLASSIAKDPYGRAFDPDGNPVPFITVNGEEWTGPKTGATGLKEFHRNAEGKVIHGERHEYIVHRTGYFVAKLKDTGLTPEAIQQIVLQDFRDNCEEPDNVKKDPAPGILRDIKKFLSKVPEYEKDPEWKQYCIFAWRAENGGEEWDSEKAAWDEVTAAGLRAKDEQATLEQLRAKVPGRKKQPEQPAGGADPGAQLPEEPEKDLLDAFLEEIQTTKFEPISTGIKDIDRALYGGFLRRTLVTLAAAPGAGKTALAQWIFENMAAAGHDVLYINLEMDRAQLLARSISRLAWKRSGGKGTSLSALEILRGYEWKDIPGRAEMILGAANEYRERIAPRFRYNPDSLQGIVNEMRGNDIRRIIKAMKEEVDRVKGEGRPEPIFCIDYLQIIEAPGNTTAEQIQTIIKALKDFAIENNTVVFLISAQNRAANKAGISEMESGRDTSAIEYSGDLMLGLVYTAIENGETWTYYERDEAGKILQDKNGNPKKITKAYDLERIRELLRKAYDNHEAADPVCSRLTLKVLKNRFGAAERRANFIFDGEHGTFHQVEREDKPEPEDKGGEWQQGSFPT